MMRVYALDHVQVAMPPREEERARRFYRDLLGMVEIPKPPELARRGGVWFSGGSAILHLGVEVDFKPARKAHPAFLVEGLPDILERCQQAGYQVNRDIPLEGYHRIHVFDPFGNRIELMERVDQEEKSKEEP